MENYYEYLRTFSTELGSRIVEMYPPLQGPKDPISPALKVLVTVPRARAFILYDLRNGGDPTRPHGIVEVQLRNGHAVHKGMKTTLSELRRMRRKGWKKICPVPSYFIVSKETGKLGYFWKHAYTEAKSGRWRSTVTNPDTGQSIPAPDGGYLCRADFGDVKISENFHREKDGTQGHSALWEADSDKIQRMAPLEYIGRYMKSWWDYSIADELHQLANDTAQGNNLDVLRRCARKLIGLTGTMMGGYADDLFNIFYRMEPRKMVEEGFEAGSQGRGEFQSVYGVLESVERIPDIDNACTRAARSTVRLGRKPGASPLLFGKFLMRSTAFVTLEDIADHLPSYEESVVEVDMDSDLGEAYAEIEKDITQALKSNRGNRSLMSLMLHRRLLYPDHPFGVGEIWGKRFDPHEGHNLRPVARPCARCSRRSRPAGGTGAYAGRLAVVDGSRLRG